MKVLFVMTSLGNGGVEKMIMSWIAGFDHDDIKVDIIAQGIESENNKKHLEQFGCKVYNMPYRYRETHNRIHFLNNIIGNNSYDIIHVHTCTSLDYLCLKIAYQNNVKVRIAHSHSSGLGYVPAVNHVLHWINKARLRKYATAYFACSTEAAIHLFGRCALNSEKMYFVPNGIDTEKFKYSAKNRKDIRYQYGLSDSALVLGFVGRYDPQKRHDYVVQVLNRILEMGKEDCHLFLIGDGVCKDSVIELANQLHVQEHITFIAHTNLSLIHI